MFIKLKRILIAVSSSVIALAVANGVVGAQTGNEISFGIRPTQAYADRLETFSYFSYELSPGAQISDEALVINSGETPVTLKIYSADGITSENGGTAFPEQGQSSTGGNQGVSDWIALPVSEITLQPGQQMTVPFTLKVPSDAAPGYHVAGLVVEDSPTDVAVVDGGGEDAQFSVKVIRRVGVAVVVNIPGPIVAGLEIKSIQLLKQDDQGATFAIAVHNSGNIFAKLEGVLIVTDNDQRVLLKIPLSFDTILPGDSTFYDFTYPVQFSDSDYQLHVALNYANSASSALYNGGAAFLEGSVMKIRDGQPVEVADESLSPPTVSEVPQPGSAFNLQTLIIDYWRILFGLVLVICIFLCLVILFAYRRKKLSHNT